ncbi:MAG: hypothetical protein PHD56_02185 [Anaerostipes sp.]|nr:hypothetical protein [Anaerostipes sp.]MDD4369884.1 hypothetical protein [Anaerostipes sp.]
MTIQEKIEFRQYLPYDAMGDYSVFSKSTEQKKNVSIKEEKSIHVLKRQKARR